VLKKETLIGKILEHQTAKADPSLDFKWNRLEDDKPKELVLFHQKAAIQKLKLLLFIIMNPLLLLQS
jgi:transcription termination factor Rho